MNTVSDIIVEIDWTPDALFADAKLTKDEPEYIVVHFEGKDAAKAEKFEGTIRIAKKTGSQAFEYKYDLKDLNHRLKEIVPYQLVGQFTDDSFYLFQGKWSEEGRVFDFTLEITW
jgi:hypothetical protein